MPRDGDDGSRSLKTSDNSWPVSRVRTKASGITCSGCGKRMASPPPAKFARKRRRCEASTRKSVCIRTCSAKSSVAWRTPRRRTRSKRSAHSESQRRSARSASSRGLAPGRKHLIATSVPSARVAKKTSAMLPLACALGSIDRRDTSWACMMVSTSSARRPLDQRAATWLCKSLKASQTLAGKRSLLVANHCASFTKVGPQ
mmetsp:Transcript_11339/g.32436  ORF Transcript_11339/g.32436 Transcript_11339/m.32436 type:complete len:201 (-) Transcript_11339:166-768(-)